MKILEREREREESVNFFRFDFICLVERLCHRHLQPFSVFKTYAQRCIYKKIYKCNYVKVLILKQPKVYVKVLAPEIFPV